MCESVRPSRLYDRRLKPDPLKPVLAVTPAMTVPVGIAIDLLSFMRRGTVTAIGIWDRWPHVGGMLVDATCVSVDMLTRGAFVKDLQMQQSPWSPAADVCVLGVE